MSPSFLAYLETLKCRHNAQFFHAEAEKLGIKVRDDIERGNPLNKGDVLTAEHPVIRTNPVTGWKALYVNRGFSDRIMDVTKDESDFIYDYVNKIGESCSQDPHENVRNVSMLLTDLQRCSTLTPTSDSDGRQAASPFGTTDQHGTARRSITRKSEQERGLLPLVRYLTSTPNLRLRARGWRRRVIGGNLSLGVGVGVGVDSSVFLYDFRYALPLI